VSGRRGFFAVDRGVFEHPAFMPEPFTEVQAWLWMISAAVWKPKRTRAGRAIMQLERGQLAFSSRFLARKWRWPEARVRRFLKRLESDAMVTLRATHQTTHITLCNYDKYNSKRHASDAQATHKQSHERRTQRRTDLIDAVSENTFVDALSDAQTVTRTTQRRTSKQVNKRSKYPRAGARTEATEKEKELFSPDAPPRGDEEAPEPVNEPPKAKLFRKGKTILISLGVPEKQSGSIIGRWLKQKNDPEGILAALEYAAKYVPVFPIPCDATVSEGHQPWKN
jgi:hypothetical protein